jgi:hypothetical protein
MRSRSSVRSQAQGPIDGGVAAVGDDDMPAAEIFAPQHQIEDAAPFELFDPGQRRAVRAERADPGGDDDGAGGDANAGGAFGPEPFHRPIEADDRAAEVIDRRERRRLLDEAIDEIAGGDSRIARDVVDRLFRIERRALAAGLGEGVEQMAAQAQHAAFENREEPNRTGADDRDIGLFFFLLHAGKITPQDRRTSRTIVLRKQMLRVLALKIYNS